MIGVARVAALLALSTSLSGCIVAAIPIAASSAIVKTRIDAKRVERQGEPAKTPVVVANKASPPPSSIPAAQPVHSAPPPSAAPTVAPRAGAVDAVPETMQYLYGSGEGAGASIQAYRTLTRYLGEAASAGRRGKARQVVLSDGATLSAPQFEPCGPKPLAIVLDIDETVLLNLGFESDAARRGGGYDAGRWARWEQTGADRVVAVPGAKAAIDAARAAGIAVIFNSNRTAENAAATEAALVHAGLGPVKHGSNLWLKGDDGGGSDKDDRRWAIASGYCVIALVGDQLGDFSDLFNDASLGAPARRALAGLPGIAPLWGNGWFLLPNPVYGTALKGGQDDIFPIDTRWNDPGQAPAMSPPGAPK